VKRLVAGVWLALGHVVTAFGCFITIVGIPFGIQHMKLAVLALAPVDMTIVSTEMQSLPGSTRLRQWWRLCAVEWLNV